MGVRLRVHRVAMVDRLSQLHGLPWEDRGFLAVRKNAVPYSARVTNPRRILYLSLPILLYSSPIENVKAGL